MNDGLPRLLTVDEAAATLHVSRWRTYELVRTGILPAVRLGRTLRFNPAVLNAFITGGGTAPGDALADASD